MNLEFAVPHKIVSKWGDLLLNVADASTGRKYIIQSDSYKVVPSLRVTQDNISMADGSVLHPRWKTGVVATITVALWIMSDPADAECADGKPACDSDLREMEEELLLHLNAMRKLETVQRLMWTPKDYGDDRMLTDVQLLAMWDPSFDLGGVEAVIQFALESPFPYGIDATEISTAVGASGSSGTATVTNAGNSPQSPVVQVHGPTSGFTLTNNDDIDEFGDPKSVVYSAARPGGAAIGPLSYAEIDFFRGTIYLNGDSTNLIAGVDPTETDFWALQHGDNDIEITGADCTVLSNNAWA